MILIFSLSSPQSKACFIFEFISTSTFNSIESLSSILYNFHQNLMQHHYIKQENSNLCRALSQFEYLNCCNKQSLINDLNFQLPDLALAWGESTLVQIAARDGMKDHLPLLLSHGSVCRAISPLMCPLIYRVEKNKQ